jgi:hypothetical protein
VFDPPDFGHQPFFQFFRKHYAVCRQEIRTDGIAAESRSHLPNSFLRH